MKLVVILRKDLALSGPTPQLPGLGAVEAGAFTRIRTMRTASQYKTNRKRKPRPGLDQLVVVPNTKGVERPAPGTPVDAKQSKKEVLDTIRPHGTPKGRVSTLKAWGKIKPIKNRDFR